MISSVHSIYSLLDTHPVARACQVHSLAATGTHQILELKAAADWLASAGLSAGSCGLLMDFAARKLGLVRLGNCYVSECELCMHHPATGALWQLSVTLGSITVTDASFTADLYLVSADKPLLVASAQGSLMRN